MNYNLEHYAYISLQNLGHDVIFYGYRGRLGRFANVVRMVITRYKFARDLSKLFWLESINDEIKKIAREFKPNIVLSIKGEVLYPKTVKWLEEKLMAATVLWYPDDPRYFNSLVKYIASSYNYVFTASERIKTRYEKIGIKNCHYLPFACEPTIHRKLILNQKDKAKYAADIVFIGTYSFRRAKIITRLEKEGFNIKVYGPYWRLFRNWRNYNEGIYGPEMVKALNSAKMTLNIHVEDDLPYKVNMRTFEATGSGAFLLTDRAYGIEKAFHVGREIVTFNDVGHLVKLVKYYLDAEGDRKSISREAHERAYQDHIYQYRLAELINVVDNNS